MRKVRIAGLRTEILTRKIQNTKYEWLTRACVVGLCSGFFNVRIMELFCDRRSRTIQTSVTFRIRLLSFSM